MHISPPYTPLEVIRRALRTLKGGEKLVITKTKRAFLALTPPPFSFLSPLSVYEKEEGRKQSNVIKLKGGGKNLLIRKGERG